MKQFFIFVFCGLTFCQTLSAQEKIDTYGISTDAYKKLLFKVILINSDDQKIVGFLEHLGQDSLTISTIKYVAVNKKENTHFKISANEIKKIKFIRVNKMVSSMLKTHGFLVSASIPIDLTSYNNNPYIVLGTITFATFLFGLPVAALIGFFVGNANKLRVQIDNNAKLYHNNIPRIEKFLEKHAKKKKNQKLINNLF